MSHPYTESTRSDPVVYELVTIGGRSYRIPVLKLALGAGGSYDGDVSAATPLPVSVMTSPAPVSRGPVTDISGTIAVGGSSQLVVAANPTRNYLFIQNVSGGDLWFDFGVAAVTSQPSILLLDGTAFEMAGTFISTDSVNIIGASTGQAFSAKEG